MEVAGNGVKYDYRLSTEENHENHPEATFVGSNNDIRPLLDYTYHKMYQNHRVQVQDDIISRFTNAVNPRGDDMLPWVVFTAGAMGAGKGYITDWMEKKGYFPKEHFVVIDPDEVRKSLPEWDEYVKRAPQEAGAKTQKEAGLIAEILGFVALRDRMNVIFDGSLRNAAWYVEYFAKLRKEFPGIRIMILHVAADVEEVIKRAAARAKLTGRAVPEELLRESAEAVPKSIDKLAPHADFVVRVMNHPDREPEVVRVPGAPFPPKSVDISWDLIKSLWGSVDLDGDGELSKSEVHTALATGLLTEAVLETMDINHDGCISKQEVQRAAMTARRSASIVMDSRA